jgi:Cu-Zn family superoxide dismutase
MPIQETTMNVRTMSILAASASVAFSMTGCASAPSARYDAVAALSPASGSQAGGTVSFRTIPGGVHMDAALAGLPQGEHGFHIHEAGDCSAADASSAKGHFNPFNKPHGGYAHGEHHAGDMPNLTADASGKAVLSVDLPGLVIGAGETNILGRSVVIHVDPDDYKSQPAGNSGKRIACGVIRAG